ncbi:MAG: hypothetical protein D6815_12945 [Candidatus Dadabacteria bacterium]|nr:MAG: hypothetical protein D6815_12945 [Candidatus Dadabacteria bacterium]
MAKQSRHCYEATGSACSASDPAVTRALDRLEKKVLAACPDDATVRATGYGPLMTPATLVAQLEESCTGNAASLAARAFGGPHAASLAAAAPSERTCLLKAHKHTARLLGREFRRRSSCINRVRKGGQCDLIALDGKIAAEAARTTQKISAACKDVVLRDLVALDPNQLVARTQAQARCAVAEGHPSTQPLSLDCGPRPQVSVPPRGQAVQIVLDEATWGTRCALGDPYALWIRLAPDGFPVENIVFHLSGGGFCLTEPDCLATDPKFWFATDDAFPQGGWFDTSRADNPFKDWTLVYLPYCTQDGHTGGGKTSVFSAGTVDRYGGINARTALGYVRDVL